MAFTGPLALASLLALAGILPKSFGVVPADALAFAAAWVSALALAFVGALIGAPAVVWVAARAFALVTE